MRRSVKGHSRLTRMLPRHDIVLTGFALALGTRRSLDATRFLVEAGRDEAAGNTERQAPSSGRCNARPLRGSGTRWRTRRKGWPNWRTTFRPTCRLPTSSHPRVTGLMS